MASKPKATPMQSNAGDKGSHPQKVVHRSGSGFKLFNAHTGKPLDKHPVTKADALKQLGAIEAAKHGGFKGGK